MGLECRVSAEDGSIECLDFRRASSGPLAAAAAGGAAAAAAAARLWRIAAHSGAATALQQQQQLPGLLVSCGLDEVARVWDLRGSQAAAAKGPPLLHEKDLKVGPLFSCRASEEKGVFGFGGSQVVIWDLGDTEHIAKAFNL
ncbi:hypothetical protein, conserved [Eimeria tenella]|uniref:Uncharacterized protein n=1 Tax=Eimeria tenella TaxID=5802 RepID=U6L9L5_EIMTE|nr:hypothetical protein, conserved [Eimeria tenella]CDJ44435.1 hypothetical protein, conserved [Eimeria tenella]|eukprot:XP_013235184.1 hypothetical protein, conserved [Eimeria tenella]